MTFKDTFKFEDGRIVRIADDGTLTFCVSPGANEWSSQQKRRIIQVVRTCLQRKERGIENVTLKFAFDSCAPTAHLANESEEVKEERRFTFFVCCLMRAGTQVSVPVEALTSN